MKANGRPIQLVPINALKTFAKSVTCLNTDGLQNNAANLISVKMNNMHGWRKQMAVYGESEKKLFFPRTVNALNLLWMSSLINASTISLSTCTPGYCAAVDDKQ